MSRCIIAEQEMKFTCPCCGYKTLEEKPPGTFNICPVCHWEDDHVQFSNPDFAGGANKVSLREAQQNYRKYGACEQRFLKCARHPKKDEKKDVTWRPL